MKRHAVPQNIMDVQFKLFGSLSIRQFGLLSVNVIFALFFYATSLPGVLKWPVVLFFVILGMCMALVTVNGLPFTTWFGNFLLALLTSQKRVWKKSAQTPDILRGSYKAEGKYTTHKITSAHKAVREMPLLSDEAILTTTKMDEKEEDELLRIDKHLKNNYTTDQLEKKNVPVQAPKQSSTILSISKKSGHNLAGHTDLNRDDLIGTETGDSINITKLEKNVIVNRPLKRRDPLGESEVGSAPDVQADQKSDDQITVSNFNDVKHSQLSEDMDILPPKRMPVNRPTPAPAMITANEPVVELDRVSTQIAEDEPVKLQEATKIQSMDEKLPEEPDLKEMALQDKIAELEKQLKAMQEDKEVDMHTQTVISKEIDKAQDAIQQVRSNEEEQKEESVVPDLDLTIKPSQRPNIVVGVVLSQDDVPISDVTVEIKDPQNFPLRKVRTDKNGQFNIPTALPNGEYLIDFDKKGRKFTDYRITLRGQILPILKFKEQSA